MRFVAFLMLILSLLSFGLAWHGMSVRGCDETRAAESHD